MINLLQLKMWNENIISQTEQFTGLKRETLFLDIFYVLLTSSRIEKKKTELFRGEPFGETERGGGIR